MDQSPTGLRETVDAAPAEGAWPRWAWHLLIAVGAADWVWLAVTPLSLDAASWWTIAALTAMACAANLVLQRTPTSPKIRVFVTGLSFVLLAWPALRLLNHLTMSTALPLADARLAAWDALIGFDWLGYVLWVDRYPLVLQVMEATYTGLTFYSLITFLVLLVAFGASQARDFVLIFFVTGVVVSVMGLFFPAMGAIVFYAPDPAQFQTITSALGTYHLHAIDQLRTNAAHVLSLDNLPGLVTFPSFHTAMGVIGIYCCRARLPFFLLSLAVNGTMIASTPVLGSHYVVDVFAGAAVALLIAWLLTKPNARSSAAVVRPAARAGAPALESKSN
jgi:membrane-associated phospholipid phosphatase